MEKAPKKYSSLKEVSLATLKKSKTTDNPPEATVITDANLDVVLSHLAFKPFLQSQDGGVNSVLQFQVLRISIEKEIKIIGLYK